MADEIPLIVERDGKVLTLSLNNVDKKNALTSEIMGALSAILEDVENYEDLRVIIIKGRGSVFVRELILVIGILKNCRSCYFHYQIALCQLLHMYMECVMEEVWV